MQDNLKTLKADLSLLKELWTCRGSGIIEKAGIDNQVINIDCPYEYLSFLEKEYKPFYKE